MLGPFKRSELVFRGREGALSQKREGEDTEDGTHVSTLTHNSPKYFE